MNLKFAFRQLGNSPGFTIIAIITLALGIGLSTSSFSTTNAFLMRSLPYPESEHLVRIFGTSEQSNNRGHAPGIAIEVVEQVQSYEKVAVYHFDTFALGFPGEPPVQVNTMQATPDFFEILQAVPEKGRLLLPGEDDPGSENVVILTQRSWERYFGKDPNIIGEVIRLNFEPHTVIGILPASFNAPLVWGEPDVITNRMMHPSFRENRSDTWMQLLGRLKPGVSLESAQAELDLLAERISREYPQTHEGIGLRVTDLATSNMDSVSRTLLWLMTIIALTMLLIACANLASLQVARGFSRSREISIRAALGGNRRQLLTPLLLESMLLSVMGGVLGILIASWTNTIIGSQLLINDSRGFDIPIDQNVLKFAIVITLLSGISFGFAPAWISSRSSGAEALKEGSRASTGGKSQQILKKTLITAEIALAFALVSTAFSFGVGARNLIYRDLGWNMDKVFVGFIALPYSAYSAPENSRNFQQRLLDELSVIPGVEAAALAGSIPYFNFGFSQPFEIEGSPAQDAHRLPIAQAINITSEYFDALEVPIRSGSTFHPQMTAEDPPTILINQAMALRFWPNEDPIGKRIRFNGESNWREIIGVSGDIIPAGQMEAPPSRYQVFMPYVQAPSRHFIIVLKTTRPPESITQEVRRATASVDSDVPVSNGGSIRDFFEQAISNLSLVVTNLSVSAGMGLLIASIGLFGVISQITAQRTRDIGVRVALGATSQSILRMVLREGLSLLILGLIVGIPIFILLRLSLAQTMPEMQLPGFSLMGIVTIALSTVMFLACYLPARKATQISPAEALRTE